MNNLPKRDDTIYKEIESFEDYELTQCIAYEMAIRNKNNLEAVNKAINYYKKEEKKINDIDENDTKLWIDESIKLSKVFSMIIAGLEIIPYLTKDKELYEVLGYSFSDADDFIDNILYYKDIKRINNDIYKIIDDEILCSEYRGILSEEPRVVYDEIDEDTECQKRTLIKTKFRDGFIIKTNISTIIEDIYNSKKNVFLESTDDWKNYIEECDYDNISSNSYIVSDFKRPKLKLKSSFSDITPKIEIDLSKPLDEIMKYIKHVKNDLENNPDISQAPIELLGIELQKMTDNKNIQKKPKAYVYADWFYIYDYWKCQKRLNISDDDIFIDLELSNNDFYKKDNIRKIRDKMIYFIDKLGYRELITGVKIL